MANIIEVKNNVLKNVDNYKVINIFIYEYFDNSFFH